MKLRTRKGSIRLRLTQSEVADFASRGAVEESIDLAPANLAYRIEQSAAEGVTVRFDGARIVVAVPAALVKDFCETDRVGFEGTDGAVHVLVEKDWQCLKPRDEDEADAYPHPAAGK